VEWGGGEGRGEGAGGGGGGGGGGLCVWVWGVGGGGGGGGGGGRGGRKKTVKAGEKGRDGGKVQKKGREGGERSESEGGLGKGAAVMYPFHFTQVLLQDNSSDCGLFVLQYVESLFTVSDPLCLPEPVGMVLSSDPLCLPGPVWHGAVQ